MCVLFQPCRSSTVFYLSDKAALQMLTTPSPFCAGSREQDQDELGSKARPPASASLCCTALLLQFRFEEAQEMWKATTFSLPASI